VAIAESPDRSDVVETAFVSGVVSVSTSEVEAKAGSQRLAKRQIVLLSNKGASTVFIGPPGVTASTGAPLLKGQTASYPVGDLGLFLISLSSASVIVQEFA